jgi:hypothetical protein
MRKRLAGIGLLVMCAWLGTATATANPFRLGRGHGGPPAAGAGTGRVLAPVSVRQASQGNEKSGQRPVAAKRRGSAPSANSR